MRVFTWQALLFLAILSLACGDNIDEELVAEGDLSAEPLFLDCTPEESEKLAEARKRLIEHIESAEFTACMNSAFLIETLGRGTEAIVASLQESALTIRCVEPGECAGEGRAGGCLPRGTSVPSPPDPTAPASFWVEKDDLAFHNFEGVVQILAHEIAHTRGYFHASSLPSFEAAYPWSVPVQVGTCARDFEPDGWSRLNNQLQTKLSPVGKSSGSPFLAQCPQGSLVVGVERNQEGQAIALRCQGLEDEVLALPFQKESYNALSVEDETLNQPWCVSESPRSLADVATSAVGMRETKSALAIGAVRCNGATLSPELRDRFRWRNCPSGMGIAGLTGRIRSNGDLVEAEWMCETLRRVPSSQRPRIGGADLVGKSSGQAKIVSCAGNSIGTLLFGSQSEGGRLQSIGSLCVPVSNNGTPSFIPQAHFALDTNGTLKRGLSRGRTFHSGCADKEALVGIEALSSDSIHGLRPLCAPIARWAKGSSEWTRAEYVGNEGTPDEESSQSICSPGNFMVGMQSWVTNKRINGIQALCRPLP